MSSSAAAPTVIPSPDRLPPEVGGTLTALWLSIAFGLVALLAFWPMAIASAPAVFEVKDKANLANLGWMALTATVGFILLAGIAVSYQMGRKKQSGLRYLRLSMLGGMAAGVVLLGGILFLVMQAKGEAPLGPAPMLSGIMLFIAALLPFGFAIFALSYAGTDQVEAYFRPETPAEEVSYAGVGLGATPGYAAGATVGEVSEAAIEETPPAPVYGGLDSAFDAQLAHETAPAEGALAPTDQTRATHVVVVGQETMTQPVEGIASPRATMLAPAGDALDDILSEELASADAAAGSANAAEAPGSPEALDAMFSQEEGSATSLIPSGTGPDRPESLGDSIFDEDDLASDHLDHGQRRTVPDLITGPESKTSGESSIFSEAHSSMTGSGVISGMMKDSGSAEIVMPDSGHRLPAADKHTMIQPGPKPDEVEETKGDEPKGDEAKTEEK